MSQLFTLRSGLALIVWASALLAALSITNLPVNWGHSICGVWGCGPPLQALVGCHLAWLVVLGPLVELVTRSSPRPSDLRLHLGKLLCLIGASLLLTVVVYQRVMWWPAVSEMQQNYFWQRCGFIVVTSVDVPILPMMVVGLTYLLRDRCFTFPPEVEPSSPGSGAVRLPSRHG